MTNYSLVLLSFYRKIKIPGVLGRGCHFILSKTFFLFLSDVSTFLQKPLALSAKQPQLAISAMMVWLA